MNRTIRTTVSGAITLLLATVGLISIVQAPASAFVDRDCGDFASQAAAQHFFLDAGPGDPHALDYDGDGVACESNPCPCIGRGTTSPQTAATPPKPSVYRETGRVTRVIDGDTIRVRLRSGANVSVRLLGIDTPERGRCGASAATANMRRLAPVGSTVHLVSDRTQAAKDRYGRLLRYVARKGGYRDLSYRQAWNGYTKRYVFGGRPVARDGQYVRAVGAARRGDRGLWRSCW